MEVFEGLNANEVRLQAIIEATPECIKIVAPDGTLKFVNQAGLYMVEATSTQQLEGACIFDVIAPDHRHKWMEYHKRVCNGESLNWEFDVIGLNGTRRRLETHAVPVPNEDGTFSQLAVTRDVSSRKNTESTLKRNEIILRAQNYALEQAVHGKPISEVLETLVKAVEDQSNVNLFASILLIDKDGKHLRHGASPSLPESYNNLVDGVEIGPLAGSCGNAAFTKTEVTAESIATDPVWAVYKDIALSYGLRACWSTPILSSQNIPLATFALYYTSEQGPSKEDREAVVLLARTAGIVIEWYDTIAERAALMAQLEMRVEERTKELRQANIALKSSNDSLLQFAHVASHDLKEPVRKIKTFTFRLQEEAKDILNERNNLYIEKILGSAERMSTMIDGVLNYSTMNGSEQEVEKIDLNTVIEEIKTDLEIVIQQKHAVIECQQLPSIEGRRVLIHQLLYNLINNSLKFTTPDLVPSISIGATPLSLQGTSYYSIAIADNGIGFDPRHSDKIFDTFTRLNSKDKYDGTGLGLALCKKIAERHHGAITAKSEKGHGATFTILLPVLQPKSI